MGRRKEKDGEVSPVYRCDKLPTFMNPGKIQLVKAMMGEWRRAATTTAAIQWRCFFQEGGFNPFYDPATVHRKASVLARTNLLMQIGLYFGLDVNRSAAGARRRLPEMVPGLVDPLAGLKSSLGAAQVQMVREQVLGMLNSYISNRMNDFRTAVFGSSLDDDTRHQLFVVNKSKAWFDLKREVRCGETLVPTATRLLARKIMSRMIGLNRLPRMKRINMLVDQRIASLSDARNGGPHDLWLRMTVVRRKMVEIPLKTFGHFSCRRGERKQSYQIIEDRETGKIYVGVITDVGEAMKQSRSDYVGKGDLALDFGLKTMFATDQGDLLGRGFLAKLQVMDKTISSIARHVQRSGRKPRTSARYCSQVDRARGFIRTEMNRVINRLIEVRKPSRLLLERLDFRSPEMSGRMNRMIQNCGRSVLRRKLESIKEQYGIEATEVASAYTSQTCSCCGYADKRNRLNQRFKCRWCGNEMHADVNASRNVGSERFRSFGSARPGFKRITLGLLVSQHAERFKRRDGSPPDPRHTNPYFPEQWDEARLSEAAKPIRRSCMGFWTEFSNPCNRANNPMSFS